jgi:uncharacterized protein YecE (DUF72 family)
MNIRIGTSGYSFKEWKGAFYPETISPKTMLRFYAERFTTVEINNTFYHMPTRGVLASWAGQVPDDFVFALKASQVITHRKKLKDVGEEAGYLFKTLPVLGRKLGPVLFQFPRSFPAHIDALEDFLSLIPGGVLCAFEFRNSTWLDDRVLDLLSKKGCSLCIADTDETPAREVISTAPWGYLRLRRSDYADADLFQWRDRILDMKWEQAFVFFKHGEEAIGPLTALRFREMGS